MSSKPRIKSREHGRGEKKPSEGDAADTDHRKVFDQAQQQINDKLKMAKMQVQERRKKTVDEWNENINLMTIELTEAGKNLKTLESLKREKPVENESMKKRLTKLSDDINISSKINAEKLMQVSHGNFLKSNLLVVSDRGE